ncbi:hypothetical protein LTR64_008311 [Lithohypha guttulata]|uniref:Heterokaryon incompatibility domain-containing protein n=1 Tax=Lithohypha guttulata TaxID=1690604 RepID=A0AAN7Q786_9EURO|nr:hypothetical protein LTR51_008463 [Lithohypha guttulata]KAK5080373.1 hypothetical protein LTR05_008620 [Lithohypha guttulata]
MAFVYEPLSDPFSNFRLVEVKRWKRWGQIQCTIKEVTPSKKNTYEAISCLRVSNGKEEQLEQKQIRLNGKQHNIPVAVYRVLNNARNGLARKRFWVEAICVDQNNMKEREVQLSKKDEIYNGATAIRIYIYETGISQDFVRQIPSGPPKRSVSYVGLGVPAGVISSPRIAVRHFGKLCSKKEAAPSSNNIQKEALLESDLEPEQPYHYTSIIDILDQTYRYDNLDWTIRYLENAIETGKTTAYHPKWTRFSLFHETILRTETTPIVTRFSKTTCDMPMDWTKESVGIREQPPRYEYC